MILYNIGEVTDRTIHYSFFITPTRPKNDTRLFLAPYLAHSAHTCTRTRIRTDSNRTFISTYVRFSRSLNYSIYSARISFAPRSARFRKSTKPLERSSVTSRSSLSTGVSHSINCAARVTRVSTARANLRELSLGTRDNP